MPSVVAGILPAKGDDTSKSRAVGYCRRGRQREELVHGYTEPENKAGRYTQWDMVDAEARSEEDGDPPAIRCSAGRDTIPELLDRMR